MCSDKWIEFVCSTVIHFMLLMLNEICLPCRRLLNINIILPPLQIEEFYIQYIVSPTHSTVYDSVLHASLH